MRIDNGGVADPSTVSVGGAQQSRATTYAKGSGSEGASSQGAGGEKVTLSAEAQRLSHHAHAAHAAKVNRLRAALSDGSFKVDSQAIASKIVNGD